MLILSQGDECYLCCWVIACICGELCVGSGDSSQSGAENSWPGILVVDLDLFLLLKITDIWWANAVLFPGLSIVQSCCFDVPSHILYFCSPNCLYTRWALRAWYCLTRAPLWLYWWSTWISGIDTERRVTNFCLFRIGTILSSSQWRFLHAGKLMGACIGNAVYIYENSLRPGRSVHSLCHKISWRLRGRCCHDLLGFSFSFVHCDVLMFCIKFCT